MSKSKKLSDFLRNENAELEVGEYVISMKESGNYLISRSDGEEVEVEEDDLEEKVCDLFREVF